MFDAERFYMTPPIGSIEIKMFGRKHGTKLEKNLKFQVST
jgi:hypothetical protein